MPCHVAKSTGVSSRRHRQLFSESHRLRLAVLDLDKPAERSAHDFLLRATCKPDPFWKLLDMRRQAATLLCVVQWVDLEDPAKQFSLAEVSLIETAVCWRYYPTADAARAEMKRRCAETPPPGG